MKRSAALFASVLAIWATLVLVARAQTCPCSFTPAGDTSRIVPVAGSSSECETVTRATSGCFCDYGDSPDAGTCTIDTAAVSYQFVGSGPECQAVSSPRVICPINDNVDGSTLEPSATPEPESPAAASISVSCTYDSQLGGNVGPGTDGDCTVLKSEFPPNAIITAATARITQTEWISVYVQSESTGETFTVSYSSRNELGDRFDPEEISRLVFGEWPDSPATSSTGITAGPSSDFVFETQRAVPPVALTASAAGVEQMQQELESLDGDAFYFRIASFPTSQVVESTAPFTKRDHTIIFSRMTVTVWYSA
mmetsp:Transcript_16049/g.34763  ORF Transcript_16049/g.34763 Transcript_16049/m.34763 type:complete len:310 (+) Transcript_16049:93-1022(+)